MERTHRSTLFGEPRDARIRFARWLVLGAAAAALVMGSAHGQSSSRVSTWHARVREQLPLMGQRNWIVIADAAYPWQSGAGIYTVPTNADHGGVIRSVLAMIDREPHLRPVVHMNQEIAHISERLAPGIQKLRTDLDSIVSKRAVRRAPQSENLKQIEQAGKGYRVLVLKTRLALPYGSVFIELESSYWTADKEKALRSATASPRAGAFRAGE